MKIKIILFLLLSLSLASVFCANRRVVILDESEDESWTTIDVQVSNSIFNTFIFPIVSFYGESPKFWVKKGRNKYIACDMIYTSQERSSITTEGSLLMGEEGKIKRSLHSLLSLFTPLREDEDFEEIYCQGSIWWANLKDVTDESNDKQRPVLIISNSSYNKGSDEVIILKITSKKSKGIYRKYKVAIDLEEKSYIDCLSIHRIPKTNLRTFCKMHNFASEDILQTVKTKLIKIFS